MIRPNGQSALHELLMRRCENPFDNSTYRQINVGCTTSNKSKVSRLSMSAPTRTMGLEQIWTRREPRPHLLSTGSLGVVEAGSTSSLSTGGALSPDPLYHIDHLSHDEGYEDSDDDSDHYDDYSSDNGTLLLIYEYCIFFFRSVGQLHHKYRTRRTHSKTVFQTYFICLYSLDFAQNSSWRPLLT